MSATSDLNTPACVLLLATDAFGTGGIQSATRTMVSALVRDYGIEQVGLLSLWRGKGALPPCRVLYRGHPLPDGADRRVSGSARVSFMIAAIRSARHWRSRPLVVIACHPRLAPVAWAASRASRAPYVVWAHGMESWGRPRRSVGLALERADVVAAISRFTAEQVKRWIRRADVEVVHLGLPPDFVPVSGPSARDDRLVMAVSRLEPAEAYKGVDTLLYSWPRVLARVPDARLTVVGDGADRARLERIATYLGIDARVRFVGYVDDEHLRRLYVTASVFALPGRVRLQPSPEGEGFGLVFLEAGAAGLPVVAGRAGGALDAVDDLRTGFLVNPEDTETIAARVVELLEDPELARRLGDAARARVANGFSFERFAERLHAMVDRVVGERSTTGTDVAPCAASSGS
jgi:phosphatidylinositol alpha-1,6-mannosyltransferase